MLDAAASNDIQKLVRLYRKAVKDLGRQFVAEVDIGRRASIVAQMRQIFSKLDDLTEKTVKWADKNIVRLYDRNRRAIEKELKDFGLPPVRGFSTFASIHQHTVEALLNDPSTGFLSGMQRGIDEIKGRMKTIRAQATLLHEHQSAFDAIIARVGVLEAGSVNEVRDALVREMMSTKRRADLALLPRVGKLPVNNIFSNMANLPFITIPLGDGGVRHLRIDHYAELLARTKSRQASSLARRNAALSHGQDVIQISANYPLEEGVRPRLSAPKWRGPVSSELHPHRDPVLHDA